MQTCSQTQKKGPSFDDSNGVAPILLMRSRMPRKVLAAEPFSASSLGAAIGDKDIYTMDFIGGGQGRIREASRKNVIVEAAGYVGSKITDMADIDDDVAGRISMSRMSQGDQTNDESSQQEDVSYRSAILQVFDT